MEGSFYYGYRTGEADIKVVPQAQPVPPVFTTVADATSQYGDQKTFLQASFAEGKLLPAPIMTITEAMDLSQDFTPEVLQEV